MSEKLKRRLLFLRDAATLLILRGAYEPAQKLMGKHDRLTKAAVNGRFGINSSKFLCWYAQNPMNPALIARLILRAAARTS